LVFVLKAKKGNFRRKIMKMKTAILLGATGLTGGILLEKLLQDDRYDRIKIFGRHSVERAEEKIEEYLVDLFDLEKHRKDFTGDEVFCCIGTTQAKTPNEELYRKVDYGIPVMAARLANENNIKRFLVVSALGADEKSSFFYNRTKGEMERDVLIQQIPETYILQPALIAGNREEKRPFEKIFIQLMKVGDHLLVGPLKKYRSLQASAIAEAMIYIANNTYSAVKIPSAEIREIAESKR
jgi:uncharacterized protein YbjT (DUF2867 family)